VWLDAVTPVVGFLGNVTEQQLAEMREFNHDEIDDVFVLTLSQLLHPEHSHYRAIGDTYKELSNRELPSSALPPDATQIASDQRSGAVDPNKRFKVYTAGPYPVWGLTAYITNELINSVLIGPKGIWSSIAHASVPNDASPK
jgi:hypothetical protein